MRNMLSGIECIVENPGSSNAVVLFHGYGADYTDLATLMDYLDPSGDWTWIFPNGPVSVDIGYAMTGRAWFPISVADLQQSLMTGKAKDYATTHPQGLDEILGQMHLFVEDLKSTYEGIVLGGFSQGGMLATHLMSSIGDQLLGTLLLSTVLLDQEKLTKSLVETKPKAFFQSHGSRDTVLPLQQGMALYQYLKKLGWTGKWNEFSGGHEIPPQVLLNAQNFLKTLKTST